jgi:hypothetical protein
MPVSATQKQDLTIIKNVFEKKALEKDTVGAVWLPMVSSVQQSRRIHEVIRDEVSSYPSSENRKKKASQDQSFLKQKQSECIPCIDRVKSLVDIDIGGDILANLLTYNTLAIKNMISIFNGLSKPNRIQESLCEGYKSLRSQCIPDIARIIAQLKFLISSIRSFKIKSLKEQLVSLVGSLMARGLIFGTVNWDKYIALITNTARCIANDINTQISKLDPILSREGLDDVANIVPKKKQEKIDPLAELIRENPDDFANSQEVKSAAIKAGPKRTLFPGKGDFDYGENIRGKLSSFNQSKRYQDAANLIKDMLEESIDLVDNKLEVATNQLFKLLKLSNDNLCEQIESTNQVRLIMSVLAILNTIKDTRGNFDPCGENAGKNFFTKIKIPGQEIVIDNSDPNNTELNIIPPSIRIDNPVVEDILNENGIGTVDSKIKSGSIVESIPVSMNISKCLSGN